MKRGPYKVRGVSKDPLAYAKAYYRSRIEQGICCNCGRKNETRKGHSICEKCRKKQNQKRKVKSLYDND